jgi:hypothetical protein
MLSQQSKKILRELTCLVRAEIFRLAVMFLILKESTATEKELKCMMVELSGRLFRVLRVV